MSAVLSPSPAMFLRRLVKQVDRLGAINAQLSALQAEADAIKGALKASGMDEICGKQFRAVVIARDSVRLDSSAVKAILSPAQIAACSKASRSVSVSLYDL